MRDLGLFMRTRMKGLSFRPGHYAGREPTTTDLNSPLLERFYDAIKVEFGREEAGHFVRFVHHLNDLSMSSFVLAFEVFFCSDCKTIQIEQSASDRIYLDHDDMRYEQASVLVAEALAGKVNTDEDQITQKSREIKSPFLRNHLHELLPEEQKALQPPSYHRTYECRR